MIMIRDYILSTTMILAIMAIMAMGSSGDAHPGNYQGLLNTNVLNEVQIIIVDTRTGSYTVEALPREIPYGI